MANALLLFCFVFYLETVVSAIKVSLVSDSSAVVRGSNITFTAIVSDYNNEELKFDFWDDAFPANKEKFIATSSSLNWTVQYYKNLYEAGEYVAHVTLWKSSFIPGIWLPAANAQTTFRLTETLNGNLTLIQNETLRLNHFVAVNQTVQHTVQLSANELQFLKDNASTVVTYWFIDCNLVDQTTEFTLNYTYQDVMTDHNLDVLVVANNLPLPPITTTTEATTKSTTTTTTTTQAPPNATGTNLTIDKNANESLTVHKLEKRSLQKKIKSKMYHAVQDFICHNTSIIPIGESYTYGHYQETISVREPISTVNITGLNWLQHGDLLNLQVKYTGSPPFNYCVQFRVGQYNVTGNETCAMKTKTMSNNFPLIHYFSDSDQHTVVVIIENEIGKTVSRATINIYKVTVHSQLSVIVVPVVFCLVAVILVVFGVAYYQHRSRHTVEVADFDFGQQAHLDYKTFTERLRDSFRNAFNFGHDDDNEALTTNTRYNSMT